MKYLSLFSGIGGFEYGIQQSNKAKQLECIGYSEIDKYARNVYEKHYPNHPGLGDATEIKTENLPDFDFLVGGFPCQAFSVAGKRRGFCDTRGTLFFEIARILKDKKPTYFLLENVKGLLSHDKGRTFQTILKILSDLGYNVQWKIYNTKNYGIPQNRERIYIKGFSRERESGREVLSVREVKTKIDSEYERKCKVIPLQQEVLVRKYPVDTEKLVSLLKDYKVKSKLTYKKISEKLNVPKTEVEHWFRTDKYQSIPSKEVWYDLKNLLNIKDDSFDECITSFIVKEGEYDMSNRVYDSNFISPTVLASPSNIKLDNDNNLKRLGNVFNGGQAGNVYDSEGVATTLSANGGGCGGKTGLYKVGNVHPSGKGQSGNVYDSGGVSPCLDFNKGLGRNIKINKIKTVGRINNGSHGYVYDTDGISSTLTATGHKDPTKILLRNNTKQGYVEAKDGDGVNLAHMNGRGRIQEDASPTISSDGRVGTVTNDFELRRLTPRECERLQGFPDDWTRYGADGTEISDTQRYKMCGNAVTTNVISYIINTWDMKGLNL